MTDSPSTTTRLLQTPLPLAPQATALRSEEFQARLIAHISAALDVPERTQRPPRLLRAPTGSGKAFVLFLTPDDQRPRWVNDNGNLGDTVKLTDMQGVYERLASTATDIQKI